MKALALCLCFLPLSAGAEEHPLLAKLIDTLARPDLSAPELVAGMKAAGLDIVANLSFGPGGATEFAGDPLYYFVTASARLPTSDSPMAFIECSRIGAGMLPSLPSKASAVFGATESGLTVLQFSDTVDFAPGAVAQLWCHVHLLPTDHGLMPTVDQTVETLRPRFDTTALAKGPAKSEPSETSGASELYPPMSAAQAEADLQPGQSLLTGENDDPMVDRRASRITYVDQSAADLYSFDLISHLAATDN